MANDKGHNKKKKEQKKQERLARLVGIDFCACGGEYQLTCGGICREVHTNSKTGKVECGECYQIDRTVLVKKRRPKRTLRYGRQKESDENQHKKIQRREKWKRDRSE
jgi:hypothetical protein